MPDRVDFRTPEVTDTSIRRVCSIMGLPDTAFGGPDGDDPRLSVLKSLDTLDVEACPGSGKTTLLVAKLAILAGQWTDSRRGICVLSHTNVARREIETKLGRTTVGRRLLAYPHFVGTIHSFVNEFLAMPWLRSEGYPIEVIDDDLSFRRRWRLLPRHIQRALEKQTDTQELLKICDPAFDLGDIRWGKGVLGKDTRTYGALQAACQRSASDGYFYFDEMFVWANELLDEAPEVVTFLRARFPLLFIDEVQDNSEMQSALLYRLFIDGGEPVTRQRYGDANQAIYNHPSQSQGAQTDAFPQPDIRKEIPDSFRFGQSIADLVDPLAIKPHGIRGKGPRRGRADMSGRHAIFLFTEGTVRKVLETYARYLIEVFSDDELRDGVFTAVGGVHRPVADDQVPRHIGHYWSAYDYSIGRVDTVPATFVQYLWAGSRRAEESGASHPAVEKTAEGILRFVQLVNPASRLTRVGRKHRYVLDLLADKERARAKYIDLVRSLAVERGELTEATWTGTWREIVTEIVRAIAGDVELGPEAQSFLNWQDESEETDYRTERRDNIYRYPAESPRVAIRVSSIHSVKGETHTATLVLETFFRSHQLKTLKPWLLGKRSAGAGVSPTLQARLRLHYVAMTRAAQLLCLAMREDSFTDDEIRVLSERGWRIGRVTVEGAEWCE